MVLNFHFSFRAVLGLSSQLNFESFTIFCPYLGANSVFDVANVSKVSKLVFESLVWSSFLVPQGFNHNHNWSAFLLEVKKTGPDCKKTADCGFLRSLDQS